MRRRPSPEDARVVLMSLTDKTYKQLASLAAQQDGIHDYIFEEFDERELIAFTDKLAALKTRIEKACMKVTLGI
jgi:DNA-binding MarR family transcriptional regulator